MGQKFEHKKIRPCFQGRIKNPWCHLSSPVSHNIGLDKYRYLCELKQKSTDSHRYSCAVMGAPIIVSALSNNAVGMQLRGVIRFLYGNFDCSKYLSLHPLSANGTLCNNSGYLLVLFIAFSY